MTRVLEWSLFIAGILVSVFAAVLMVGNFILYEVLKAHYKAKYGPTILKLSEELLAKNNDK